MSHIVTAIFFGCLGYLIACLMFVSKTSNKDKRITEITINNYDT